MIQSETIPRQTVLPVGLTDHATFDNYLPLNNQQTVSVLKDFLKLNSNSTTCFLWGPRGCGKTHLLLASCKLISDSVYVPLMDLQLQPDLLDGIENSKLVCIDDIHSVATQFPWETGLITLFEKMESQKNLFLVSSRFVPGDLGFALRDLINRFQGRQILRLLSPSDEHLARLLKHRAAGRGLKIEEPVIQFVLTRYSRDTHALIRFLNRMDHLTLEKHRNLSIPFLKQFDEFKT